MARNKSPEGSPSRISFIHTGEGPRKVLFSFPEGLGLSEQDLAEIEKNIHESDLLLPKLAEEQGRTHPPKEVMEGKITQVRITKVQTRRNMVRIFEELRLNGEASNEEINPWEDGDSEDRIYIIVVTYEGGWSSLRTAILPPIQKGPKGEKPKNTFETASAHTAEQADNSEKKDTEKIIGQGRFKIHNLEA